MSINAARQRIADAKLFDEASAVRELLAIADFPNAQLDRWSNQAAEVIADIRRQPDAPLMDAFLKEYGLSNDEGVALMCLAESLLRTPDSTTRDLLISDKLTTGDWIAHIGRSASALVNLSSRGLALGQSYMHDDSVLRRLTLRVGDSVVRQAAVQAVKMMASEFVMGEHIEAAMSRGKKLYGDDAVFSFDMLGEGARTWAQADAYLDAYAHAVETVGAKVAGSGVSIKLSALHPRYEAHKAAQVVPELIDRVDQLAQRAAALDIGLTFDAEEADRLEMSLDVFVGVAERAPQAWQGLGFVVQAYSKRALSVIDWLAAYAESANRHFNIRLVKGAYWDSEIKHAQQLGLTDYPVFTRKHNTDLSYLVCAKQIFAHQHRLYGQFASHNVHTVLAVSDLSQGKPYELQRLHGMGEMVYERMQDHLPHMPTVRTYAPVGSHKDLLAYLVRRLLENGASSSFVHQLLDASVALNEVASDPVAACRAQSSARHPEIPLPQDLFAPRLNSLGIDLASDTGQDAIEAGIRQAAHYLATPPALAVGIDEALRAAKQIQPEWDQLGGEPRAAVMLAAADMLQARLPEFVGLLILEAGKTRDDAISEVREAIDFLRYYAAQAMAEFGSPLSLPGPTGESNELTLEGRGVFVCISPWNFPLAIYLGQICAALLAGNSVIAKPAPQTPRIAQAAAALLVEAGLPGEALQVMVGDAQLGAELIAHPLISGVAFTGSNATARVINQTLASRPGPILPLVAETGGQNALIVDATAQPEQVVDDVIRSGFLSAGQRCSALRVLYLQEDIADEIIDMLRGAMDALHVGDPTQRQVDIGPIIDAQAHARLSAHLDQYSGRNLHAGAAPDWDLQAPAGGHYLAPQLLHIDSMTELDQENFGPIVHVVRFAPDALDTVLNEIADSGYGLTLGVHTRIEQRWQQIAAALPVGNIYINRDTVGAVVGSQPFGGQGLSGTGPKAGGPRYLYRFATERTLTVNTMATGGSAELLNLH